MANASTKHQLELLRKGLRRNRKKLGKLLLKAEDLEGECDQARVALGVSEYVLRQRTNSQTRSLDSPPPQTRT